MLSAHKGVIEWAHFEFLGITDYETITDQYWSALKFISSPSSDNMSVIKRYIFIASKRFERYIYIFLKKKTT